jgi:sterol desaturase/sphingolipid hydroxylase (fatty acid hydroxylase superfamily)
MQFILAIATVFVTFEVACLAQAVLHRLVGHRPAIRSIYASHTGSHHTIYRGHTFEQAEYSREEASVSHTFLPAAAAIVLALWLLLPLRLWLVALPTIVLTFGAHVYVHAHYHLGGSWLTRYAWFLRRKELHRVHHVDPGKNFGVLEYFWDRMMGTYSGPSAS